ncbi:MAG: DUF1007 family protein [Rhizobiales bacterium]|nr:DUF1007 family protein [Hyphomicrobiales bacterium]
MGLGFRCVLIGATLALLGGPAAAHPHVWIEMTSDVVFDEKGMVTGVNIEWTFDDGYAQMALDGLDTDGDGVYSASELEALTRENLESLKDYDYFLHVFGDGKPLRIGPAKDAGQIYSNQRLMLYFSVPLETPVDPKATDFYYRIYDPEFFIAMDYTKDEPVTAQGPMPAGCKLDLLPIVTDAQTEETRRMLSTKGRDWQPPPDEDFGAMFAQPVHVDCKG